MGHARVERVNPKGEKGVFVCLDCGEQMTLAAAMNTDCEAEERTSPQAALLDALEPASDGEGEG